MPRRPSRAITLLQVTRFPLAPSWRTTAVPSWRVWAMMAKIPERDYEATTAAFEAHHRGTGTLSDDWPGLWKAWCKAILLARSRVTPAVREMVVGLFD